MDGWMMMDECFFGFTTPAQSDSELASGVTDSMCPWVSPPLQSCRLSAENYPSLCSYLSFNNFYSINLLCFDVRLLYCSVTNLCNLSLSVCLCVCVFTGVKSLVRFRVR